MKIVEKRVICSLKEAEEFASFLALTLRPGMSLGLVGDLGAGKTTISKFLVSKLGSKEEVTSPTYVLQHEYIIEGGLIEHWDLYRLKSCPEELLEPLDSKNLRIIEWSDKFPELGEKLDFVLKIEILSQTEREFLLSRV